MGVQTKNTDRLQELLSPHRQNIDILTEAAKEIEEERAEGRKKRAKELIVKCLDLKEEMDAAERRFNGEKKKADKQLGKLMNQLNNMVSGKPIQSEGDDDADEDEGDTAED